MRIYIYIAQGTVLDENIYIYIYIAQGTVLDENIYI